jgi:hypothetical protein
VAIVPRMCVRWEIEQRLLVEVKIRQLRMPRDLYLLYRRRGPLSHAATAMLQLLRPGGVPVGRVPAIGVPAIGVPAIGVPATGVPATEAAARKGVNEEG